MSDRHPRILISRLSAIGDCVLATPLLCALRDHLPNAHLAWVTERAPATLLEGHAALDELIVVPKRWMKSAAEIRQLRSKLRASRFDIAIDPQGLTKSSIVAWLSGAKQRIGFHKPRGRELSCWFNRELVTSTKTHVVDARFLELLKPLGILNPATRFDLPVIPEVEGKADAMIHAAPISARFRGDQSGCGSGLRSCGRRTVMAAWPVVSASGINFRRSCFGPASENESGPNRLWLARAAARCWPRRRHFRNWRRYCTEPACLSARTRGHSISRRLLEHLAWDSSEPLAPKSAATRATTHPTFRSGIKAAVSASGLARTTTPMLEIDVDSVVAGCEELLVREPKSFPRNAA